MSVMTDIRDLSVSLSMRELVVRSNSSNGQPPSSGVVGDSSRGPTPQVIFSTMLTFPEGICGLFVSSWRGVVVPWMSAQLAGGMLGSHPRL